jgi:cobalt/nickel transport system permease protein
VHIPDGYLSPVFSLGLGFVTIPTWGIAVRRVQAVLTSRTIPLLAIFSAMAFTIMMFNIPVPGGTTAHGVGGTLIAIVLGPWAAVIAVSVALIIQALFFGDGGVLAILVNCLNMAIILPFVGYGTYRLIAARSPVLSNRRVWAAGIGAYVGITVSALCVGIELGLQPLLFSQAGVPLYSPYTLAQAIPAMVVAHALGASIVEALVTAFGVAYLQRRHPEYLVSLRPGLTGRAVPDAPIGDPSRPLWQLGGAIIVLGLGALAMAGLVTGGGDPGRAFGADWGQVDWAGVVALLALVGVLAVVILPLAWFVLPRRIRAVGTGFAAAAILAPLGLIAPGFAYGEGSSADVQAAFGYVPSGLRQLSGLFSAPLAGYSIPIPFLSGPKAALWQSAIGYELAGAIGITILVVLVVALGSVIGHLSAAQGEPTDRPRQDGRIGWLEHTLAGITGSVARAVFSEEHARSSGWLQRVDPRAKLAMFLLLVLAANLSGSLLVLGVLYAFTLGAAIASRVPLDFFVRRVWLGVPLFAGIVVIPAIFLVPGPPLFELTIGPLTLAPSIPGIQGAILFVSRVGLSVSLAVLLVVTTPWADLLKSLQAVRVPHLFVLVLAMAYRYIFLFLHLANGMFEARKSRVVARTSGGEQRRFIAGTMGNLVNRSVRMSNDVYAAMAARGFSGSIRTYQADRMRPADWLALAGSGMAAALAVLAGRVVAG